MGVTRRNDRQPLRLVASPALAVAPQAATPAAPGSGAALLARRPGERYEVWPVGDGPWLESVARVAEERRLSISTVAAALIERFLVVERLVALELDPIVDDIDALAAQARVSDALWSASAAYVRYLGAGDDAGPQPSDEIALPARLSDRVRNRWPIEPDPDDAGAAIAWEVASAVQGRTVSEWALDAALAATVDCAS